MILITLIVSIILSALVMLWHWCKFRPSHEFLLQVLDNSSSAGTGGGAPTLRNFLYGQTTCQLWTLNFTMPTSVDQLTSGSLANWNALRSEWNSKESFRLVFIAYINIFLLFLFYVYVMVRNFNQYNAHRSAAAAAEDRTKEKSAEVYYGADRYSDSTEAVIINGGGGDEAVQEGEGELSEDQQETPDN